jgi:hypothetical protein
MARRSTGWYTYRDGPLTVCILGIHPDDGINAFHCIINNYLCHHVYTIMCAESAWSTPWIGWLFEVSSGHITPPGERTFMT